MTKLNPYEDTGRIHRRKGYAINQRFFLAARYTLENKADYMRGYIAAGRYIDDRQATLLMRTMTITRKEIGYAKIDYRFRPQCLWCRDGLFPLAQTLSYSLALPEQRL